eukprot:m.251419 g.251419  ORF g.251419 m.251419 type:complete len:64 (+) comp40336_c0_seq16:2535-2726(+)
MYYQLVEHCVTSNQMRWCEIHIMRCQGTLVFLGHSTVFCLIHICPFMEVCNTIVSGTLLIHLV